MDPLLIPPAGLGSVEHPRVASPPQKPLVDFIVKRRVVRVRDPPVRSGYPDIVVYRRGAGGELGDHSFLGRRAQVVGEELPMVMEVVRVEARVHGLEVVVDERLFGGWRWGTV